MVSIGRQKFGTDLQLMFRILKGLLFLGFVCVLAVLFVVCTLTVSDVFACILGFLPTGWCILLVSKTSIYLILCFPTCAWEESDVQNFFFGRSGKHALHWLRRLLCGTPSWSLGGHTTTSWVSSSSFPSASCRGFPSCRSSRHGCSSTKPSAGASKSQGSLPDRRTLGSSNDCLHSPSEFT